MNNPSIKLDYNPNDKSFIGIDFVYPPSSFVDPIHFRVGLGEHCFRHKMTLDEAQKLQRELLGIIQSLS